MRQLKSFAQKYPHWRLLLYWPVFGLLFLLAERGNLSATYYQMHCALDDKIPFCELFLLPYLFWFVYMIGMVIYLFFTDGEEFTYFMFAHMRAYAIRPKLRKDANLRFWPMQLDDV